MCFILSYMSNIYLNSNLLKTGKIKATISSKLRELIPALHIVNSIDSTNTYVLSYCKHEAKSGFTCLAEQQTAGRGRWGRTWVSPYASHLYLSMFWQFPVTQPLSGLSLAIGVAITNVLKQLGIHNGVGLKWPNDVYWQQKKLAGVLVETSSINTVIGIGLNVKMPDEADAEITQPWTDLHKILGAAPDRNLVAGLMISELLTLLPQFSEHGFAPFLKDWKPLDINYHKPITLQTPNGQYSGIAQGINSLGELIIQCEDGVKRSFHSAEVLSPIHIENL